MSKYPSPFGKHLLLERINVGGMAEVFKAKSFGVAGFERVVAVKRILPTLQEDDEFITMFIDEARIAAHLTHQNIVQIYELGNHDDSFFISMEYVAGRDLRQILDDQKRLKRPMAVAKACFIVSQVCEALEYAHRKKDPAGKDLKIIHRDVTPQNVIISYEGEVKLCDFGIAKAASRASRTQVGVLKGKFAYMSPEQVRGQPTDRRSDLFALGVIFFEMLTGERLFLGESDYSTLEAVRNAQIPDPTKFNPNVSPELKTILMKLMAREPKDRYQWGSDVYEDLQDHLIEDRRLYHARHLRQWMQDVYAREIEVENARLEEFMRMPMPSDRRPPSGREFAETSQPDDPEGPLAVEGSKEIPMDPADAYRPIEESDAGDATDNIELPKAPPKKPMDWEEGDTHDGGSDDITGVGSSSPVSSLFGTPQVSDEESKLPEVPDDDVIVVAQEGSDPAERPNDATAPIEEPDNEVERTLFDMKPIPNLVDGNDTVFDDDRETMGHDSISDVQREMLENLSDSPLGEDNDTIDGSNLDSSGEVESAGVIDAPTPLEGIPAAELDEGDLEDETSIQPMAIPREATDEDAFAATMIRSSAEMDAAAEEELGDAFVDDGTLQETPAGMIGAGSPTEESEPGGSSKPRVIKERKGPDSVTPPPHIGPPEHAAPSQPQARPFQGQVGVDSTGVRGPRRDPVVLMLVAAAVGLLSVSVLVFTLLSGGSESTTASLQIVTEPTRNVEVRLDGRVVANETPVELEDISVGAHSVELIAEGFRQYTQQIQITQPKPHTMVVPLEPLPEGAKPPQEDPPPEKTPESKDDNGGADESPTVAKAPPPTPQPTAEKRAPPPPRKPRAAPKGFLLVSTRPPGVSVLIDGKATGLRTPIRKPHALKAGRHQITFVMPDGEKKTFGVTIAANQTVKMQKVLR